jgi:very-short-patch-repair endonuclease
VGPRSDLAGPDERHRPVHSLPQHPGRPQIAAGWCRPVAVAAIVVRVVEALTALGGAAYWRQLRQAGVTWYALWRALQAGEVTRLRRGTYALTGLDSPVVSAIALGGLLACTSAAVALGLPVLVPHGVHVVVPRGWSHACRPGTRVHRRNLGAGDRAGITTSLLRTVLDCARELPLREAVVICDAALRAGLEMSELQEAALSVRGPRSGAVRRVVEVADGRSESAIESCLRLLVLPLAAVRSQVHIAGVGRVDLLVDGWLVLEADGFEFHRDRASYRNDRRRHNALVAAGYTVLRFTYEDVVHDEERVLETIRAVLARGR